MAKVSVIMPVYNAEKYIGYAIESILNQNYSDLELIIINDQGTDKSMDIVQGYKDSRILILDNECNKGIAFSRNRGINAANGEYIAIMDDDDWAPEYRIGLEVEYLDNHPDISVVGGAANVIDQNNTIINYCNYEMLHNPKRIKAELMFHDVIPNSSAMIRKNFIDENHLRYKDNMCGMEDYEFWIQCSLYGNITNLNQVLLHWRDTMSNETSRMKMGSMKELRKQQYKNIQKSALIGNKFCLSDDELDCFCRFFPEESRYSGNNIEIKKLYEVLSKIVHQASGSDFEYELEYVCKKMFALSIQYSDIFKSKWAL